VLKLPHSREELLQLLSKRQRANLRNARSQLQRAGGGTVEIANQESLPEFLDDLFRLHAKRWSRLGEPGVLADESVKAFHRRAAPALLAQGILRVYRLRVEQFTAAILYTMRLRDTLFCYLQGFDPDFAHLSPGTYLIFRAMEDAMQLGVHRFDFLRGDEDYKRHWHPEPETTYRLQLSRDAIPQQSAKHGLAA
jgi:CelD/BcsL family acetyltransferase involved in cellulose biosynthesis